MPSGAHRRRLRFGAGLAVAALHMAVALVLIAAFAPSGWVGDLAPKGLQSFDVPLPASLTPPSRKIGGGRGMMALRVPSSAKAAPQPAVPITMTAQQVASGGEDAPTLGSGASGAGAGTGTGTGTGTGNGAGRGAEKMSGEIRASDYPEASRPLRIGDYVIVALTIGTDGRVSTCRIHRPSRDAESDAITCRLARERFRFRPATDGLGRPAVAEFGWRQSWHY